MLFLRSWLEEYINLEGISNEKLVQIITTKSSEVEEFFDISDYFSGKVVLGKIQNVKKHPEADKLNVFEVNCGSFKVQIVSAAPNVRENLIVPVALVGAKLPFLSVGVRKLRGIESFGLCLGKSELGLETAFSSGLWEIENDLKNLEIKNQNTKKSHNLEPLQSQSELKTGLESDNLEDNFDNLLGESVCELFPEFFPVQTVLDIKVLPDKIAQIGHHLGMAIEIATILENLDLLTEKGKKGIKLSQNSLESYEENVEQIQNKENSEQNETKNKTNLELKNQNSESEKNPQKKQVLEKMETASFENKNNEQTSNKIPNIETNSIDFEDNFGGANRFDLYNLKLEKPFILPHFLQMRMFLTGRNLVGGIVDLSNYLLADMGQPSHFFDATKV